MEINKILHDAGNTLLVVSRDDLILFANTYAQLQSKSRPEPAIKNEVEQPIPQEEAVKFLKKSRQTLSEWRKKGFIKAYRLGGRIYFKKSELLSALEKLSS
ncbi:MAG: helix-turn-helix domain-containing protein [bacterium]